MAEYCPRTGKVVHASPEDCMRALRRLNRAGGPLGNPYQCAHCSGWHQTKGRSKNSKHMAFKRRRNALHET